MYVCRRYVSSAQWVSGLRRRVIPTSRDAGGESWSSRFAPDLFPQKQKCELFERDFNFCIRAHLRGRFASSVISPDGNVNKLERDVQAILQSQHRDGAGSNTKSQDPCGTDN